jgi:hypothetical protein
MISKAYEKADFQIVYFTLDDVLTTSKVVHTTSQDVQNGSLSDGSANFDVSDFFQ